MAETWSCCSPWIIHGQPWKPPYPGLMLAWSCPSSKRKPSSDPTTRCWLIFKTIDWGKSAFAASGFRVDLPWPRTQSHGAGDDSGTPLDILPFDEKANWTYGELRARTGAPRSADRALGTMIAAHALSRDAILMINNTREFSRVAGLRLENWAE